MSSLIDALLLEAPKFDVWIAARTDGLRGSGTQSDPWNGTAYTDSQRPSKTISSLTRVGLVATAMVTNHGFAVDDYVTVAGVSHWNKNKKAVTGDRLFMGTFKVLSVPSADTFTYQMVYEPTSLEAQSATGPDEPEGPMRCWLERERFDMIMRSVGPGTCVHIGPGVFETKGFSGTALVWLAQSRCRIVGSGMGSTTLKLVNASQRETHYVAFGGVHFIAVDDFEVSDLTVDCNVDHQLTEFVACGVIGISGRHNRVRRVRGIYWGSRTVNYVENFVFTLGATHPDAGDGAEGVDGVIEDCIAEWPSPHTVNNASVLVFGGGEIPEYDGRHYDHRGCTMRNNYVNSERWFGPMVQIDSITYSAGAATLTTKSAHGLSMPGNIAVRNAAVSGVLNNAYNGVFKITNVPTATTVEYEPHTAPAGSASGGTLNGGVRSHPVSIASITLVDAPTNRYRVTTLDPHVRTTNDRARLHGIANSVTFNGSFQIVSSKEKEIECIIPEPDTAGSLNLNAAFMNMGHVALSADHGAAAVCTGNRVFHCVTGGSYHDTWSTRDLVNSDNYYHDVIIGPFQNLSGVSFWTDGVFLSSLDYDDGHLLCDTLALHSFAEYENSTVIARLDPADPFDPLDQSGPRTIPHGLSVSERVIVLADRSKDAGLYNGTHIVTEVPDSWSFMYEAAGIISIFSSKAGSPLRPEGKFRPTTLIPGVPSKNLRPIQTLTAREDLGKAYAVAVVGSIYGRKKHGLRIGDSVQINWAGHAYYNGNKRVTAIPDEKTFEFEIPDDPGVDSGTAGFAPGYYGRIWQVHTLAVEGNVIELALRSLASGGNDYGRSIGVFMFVGGNAPQYSGRRLLVRDNVIRHVGNGSDAPNKYNRAIQVWGLAGYGVEESLVQTNQIRLDSTSNVTDFASLEYLAGSIQTFDNNSPDGSLVHAIEKMSPYAKGPEVVTSVRAALEESLVMALL